MDYRYPGERRTLLVTLGLLAVVILFVTPLSAGTVGLLLALGLGFRVVQIELQVRAVRRSAAPVDRYPAVARVVERCRTRLGLSREIDVYVVERRVLNAFAIGLWEPYVVVIYSGLVEALDEDELASVVGHELGHVHFGHTRLLGLVGQAGTQGLGSGLVSVLLRQVVFLFWMRASEHTADRAGLVACGSLRKALSTELKLALPPSQWDGIDVEEVIRHFRAHDVGLVEQLGSVMATHPHTHARMDHLVDFHDSALYQRLSGAGGAS